MMPLTYYPIMRVAMDRRIMKGHVNSRVDSAVRVVFLLLIALAAVAAIPLISVAGLGGS